MLHPPSPALSGYDVFISHAGDDKPKAEQLRDMLQRLGLTAFLDKYMSPGEPGDETMLRAARGAHVGLTLFSPAFAEREWPLRELEIFAGQDSLLPALVPPLSQTDWTRFLDKAEVTDKVRHAASRTVMVKGREPEMLVWQHKVCLGVVRRLVAKARRPDLCNRAGAGELRVRAMKASRLVAEFDMLMIGDVRELRKDAAALAAATRLYVLNHLTASLLRGTQKPAAVAAGAS